jgi:short-subunit dehydrogenase
MTERVQFAAGSMASPSQRSLLPSRGSSCERVLPGPTRTSFESASGARETALYKWLPVMPAAAVARAGYRRMMRGSRAVIPGIVVKLLAFAGELPPRRVALEVNRRLLKPRRSGSV